LFQALLRFFIVLVVFLVIHSLFLGFFHGFPVDFMLTASTDIEIKSTFVSDIAQFSY